MAEKLPQEVHDQIKKNWFGEGLALDIDRSKNVQKKGGIFTIDDVKKFEEWKKDHSHSDLKGFDTTDAREPTQRQVIKKLTGGTSGEDAIQDEPDRFVNPKADAGKFIAEHKKQIRDFNSFKQVVKLSWDKNGDSIKNLYDNIAKHNLDEVLKTLYGTKQVQAWLNENRQPDMIKAIMRRFGVEEQRATRVFQRLSPMSKEKLLKRVVDSSQPRLVVREPKKGITKSIRIPMIRQISSRGKSYSRSKPIRWSDMQTKFLLNNKSLPLKDLHERYNMVFENVKRTPLSLRNKIYRLKK